MRLSKDVRAFMAANGRKGRGRNSPAQIAAARKNGAKGGRPPKNKSKEVKREL